ncbi:MAG TPA: TonB-dependent receptor [Flavitalea sp.]|nr:TonB-dependent receptor [Flavitalea sp.]
MKLTSILILIINLQVSAKMYSQNVTLNLRNAPIGKLLKEITRQTGYYFLYQSEQLQNTPKVNIRLKNAELNTVLTQSLAATNLTFKIIDKTIILMQRASKEVSKIPATELMLLEIEVSGVVVSAKTGNALAGASIKLKGTSRGTTTDGNGRFSLSIPEQGGTIVFSYVGYDEYEIAINQSRSIQVRLQEKESSVDEVVVIGYGRVRKSDLTGAVAGVNNKDINRTPTNDVVAALQGQMAGVNIQQRSGAPGKISMIRVRGANSLSRGSNDPLYVIDGMILSGVGSDINMNDVESIQVLKDASATAIYGSRGANGVILITTKRGASGKTQVTYDGYIGVQKIIKELDFLDASDYKKFYLESRQNATTNTTIDTSIINSPYNTNWTDEIYRKGLFQNHTVGLRGGNEQSSYYTSFNYFNQEGIIRNSDYQRISARFNGDHRISNKVKLSENILLAYSNTDGLLAEETVSNGVAWARPTQPVLDGTGKPSFVALPFPRTNPRSLVDDVVNQSKSYRLIGNLILDYSITKNLFARVNVGTENNITASNNYTPTTLYESSFLGQAGKTFGNSSTWLNENTINYSSTFNNDHRINAVAGLTFQETKIDGLTGASTGYIIDGFQFNNLGAGSTQNSSSNYAKFSLLSYLGRVNYSFKDKWLLTLSGRYDGSSRLSEGNKFEFFPSAAVAWKISEEEFLQNLSSETELKIRASWGKTGSQTIPPYSSFSTLSNVNVYPFGGTTPSIGYTPATVANPNLTWETTTQINFGFDLSLLNDRLQFVWDFYKKNTKGLLFSRQTPPTSGYSNSVQNIGEVENKGMELLIRSRNMTGALNWSTTLNLSFNRAKVVDLGRNPAGDAVEIVNTSEGVSWFPIILGKVPYSPYGYFVDNIDKSTGSYTFKDINDDGIVDGKDQDVIGNFQPKFIFGLTNDFTFRNFDFSIFINGSVGNDVFVDAYRYSLALNGNNNILKSAYSKVGTELPIPNADYPQAGGGGNTPLIIFDGTYVRVKNITLGYTFPSRKKAAAPLSNLRVYITVTNLLTFDKDYPWYDPEVSAGDDVITGWDRGGYANNKSIVAGLRVNF